VRITCIRIRNSEHIKIRITICRFPNNAQRPPPICKRPNHPLSLIPPSPIQAKNLPTDQNHRIDHLLHRLPLIIIREKITRRSEQRRVRTDRPLRDRVVAAILRALIQRARLDLQHRIPGKTIEHATIDGVNLEGGAAGGVGFGGDDVLAVGERADDRGVAESGAIGAGGGGRRGAAEGEVGRVGVCVVAVGGASAGTAD